MSENPSQSAVLGRSDGPGRAEPSRVPRARPGFGAVGEPGSGTTASAEQVDSVRSRSRAAGATRGQGLAPRSSWIPGWDGHAGCFPWTSPSRTPALKTSPLYFGPAEPGQRWSRWDPVSAAENRDRDLGPGAGKGLAARIPLTDPGTAIGQGCFSFFLFGANLRPRPLSLPNRRHLRAAQPGPAAVPRGCFRPGGVGLAVPIHRH